MMRFLPAAVLLLCTAASAGAQRRVAVTFDDLPRVSPGTASCEELTRKLVAGIARHRMPVTAFVNESRLCGSESELERLLELWIAAGADLGNHTYAHRDLNRTPLALYQEEILLGEKITRAVLARHGRKPRYFRHPFLHAGNDVAKKEGLEKFLAAHGYRVAPVTFDNQEWVFAGAYSRAAVQGDAAAQQKLRQAYIAYMDENLRFFEQQAMRVVGREMPHVLLLHANLLNADALDDLAAMMKRRGYVFAALDDVLRDPAYALPDRYAGPEGFSWLHRWAHTRGMPIEREPREPEWVARLLQTP